MRYILFLSMVMTALTPVACCASRLLVAVDSQGDFTAEAFAKETGAALISVNPRNPYMALHGVFLETPYVVFTKTFDGEKVGTQLAVRYGYRYKEFSKETLETAVMEAKNLLDEIPKHTTEIDSLSFEERECLYTLMKKIDGVLTEGQIQYWAGRQTLLGAAYYQGLRPWDDYLHLYVLDLDDQKLKELHNKFNEEGLVLHHYWKGFYKVFDKEGFPLVDTYLNPGETLPFRYPAANIFVMTLEKRNEQDDAYVHRSEHFYSYWNFDRFYYNQIQDIKRVPFGPITIPIPGDPESYLDRVYGLPGYSDLWRKYAQERSWEHRTESSVPKGACFVEIECPL